MSPRPRRHKVALRPKVRSQRMRQLAAAGALACLGGLAGMTVLQLKREGVGLSGLKGRLAPKPRSVEVEGAPAPLQEALQRFVGGRVESPAGASELLSAFPALKSVSVSRGWLSGRLVYSVQVRNPVAVVQPASRYLDETGTVFAAPAGLFDLAAPSLEPGAASAADLKAVASFLPEAGKPGALPAALASMRFVSGTDGWEARLTDGTVLQWGDLRFTRQKFSRLREIMADYGAPASADLRYFEDGRVLLKPALRAGR